MRGWLMTIVVTLVGAVVRFWNVGYPTDKGTPIFDEKHYVPQTAQVLRNGGYEDNPGYELIVHPPLAKQLMAIGQELFGYDGIGWRFASALAGAITILLIVRIARRLTRSDLLGALAGVLLIADGVSHVQSRMGMLDIFLALFVVAAFGCLVVDREQMRERLAVAVREGFINNSAFGPWIGFRWWRFGAGVMLGAACGIKWSGIWYIAAFGLLTVVWSALARRAAGVEEPWLGALAKDVLPSLGGLVAVPVLVYVATWFPWMASETGIDRHVVGGKVKDISYIPDVLQSLWYNAKNVYKFHVELVTSETNRHPWESKPWTWPMGLRPMLYYYDNSVTGCGAASCLGAIMLIGTPAMWWLAFPVIGWAIFRTIGRMDWRYAACPGRLRGGPAAVVPQPRPADVLLLRHTDGAVPGAADRAGAGRDPGPQDSGLRTAWHRSAGRRAVRGHRGGELRVAVADLERQPDHAGDVATATVAAQLAVKIVRVGLVSPVFSTTE